MYISGRNKNSTTGQIRCQKYKAIKLENLPGARNRTSKAGRRRISPLMLILNWNNCDWWNTWKQQTNKQDQYYIYTYNNPVDGGKTICMFLGVPKQKQRNNNLPVDGGKTNCLFAGLQPKSCQLLQSDENRCRHTNFFIIWEFIVFLKTTNLLE